MVTRTPFGDRLEPWAKDAILPFALSLASRNFEASDPLVLRDALFPRT
jgi:hypothetical protein